MAIETFLPSAALDSARRYQFAMGAVVDREMSCHALLRFLRDDGHHEDLPLTQFGIRPGERSWNRYGEFVLPGAAQNAPDAIFLLVFYWNDDTQLELNYLNCYFG
jgi:hypothetical protein